MRAGHEAFAHRQVRRYLDRELQGGTFVKALAQTGPGEMGRHCARGQFAPFHQLPPQAVVFCLQIGHQALHAKRVLQHDQALRRQVVYYGARLVVEVGQVELQQVECFPVRQRFQISLEFSGCLGMAGSDIQGFLAECLFCASGKSFSGWRYDKRSCSLH